MNKPQYGMTIVEVLVAIVIVTVFTVVASTMMISLLNTNQRSRQRTSASTVMESWFERYKAGIEPMSVAGSACTGSTTTFTCTYAKGWNYASDGIAQHQASSASMNSNFQPYASVVTGTRLQKGTNRELWSLVIRVTDPIKNQTVETDTYVTK